MYFPKDQPSSDLNVCNSLSTIKLLLQRTWPHLLVKLKTGDYNFPCDHVYMMNVSPSEGLICKTLQKSQVIEEVYFIRSEDIENLKICSLFKVKCPHIPL